ncbi:MAG: hypothetical protein AB7S93_10730 [Xanthobacteraceae bacterium]
MKPGARWHVRGIRPQARETAREAARRSGMSVSQWLDSVITDAALESGVAVPPQPPHAHELPRDYPERSTASSQSPATSIRHAAPFTPPPFANGEFIPGTAPHDVAARRYPEPAQRPSEVAAEPHIEHRQSPEDRRLVASLLADEGFAEVRERLDSLARTLGVDGGLADVRNRLDSLTEKLAQDDGLSEVKERLDSLSEKLAQDDGMAAVRERLDSLTQKLAQDEGLLEINNRLDNLTQQLEAMARLNAANAQTPPASPQADPTHQVAEVISKLDRRLDEMVADNRSARSEIAERLRAVNRAVADLGDAQRPRLPSAPKTPLDQALVEIADRQRTLDGLPAAFDANNAEAPQADSLPRAQTQELAGLEQQLRQINEHIGILNSPTAIDKAVDLLRDDLAQIGVMLQEAMPRRAIEALETEMRRLSERIDQTRDAGAAGVSLAGVERGLAEVRDALRMLTPAENLAGLGETVKVLTEKVDLIAGNTQDPAALKQLEGAIVAMRGIVTHVASNDALASLTAEVRALSAKVDQVTGPGGESDVLATLEQRIGKLADALEVRNRSGQDIPRELETVLAGLSDKIERIQHTRGDEMALGHLEDRISNLVQKLDASDQRLTHLEAIERGLTELVIHLEQQRLPTLARPSSEPAPGPEVNALLRDVTGLKQMERQTQDSLEAVHGALENVVSRLATIESDIRDRIGQAVNAVVAPNSSPSIPEAAPVATAAPSAAPVAPPPVALSPAARPSSETATPELRAAEPMPERRDAVPAALTPSAAPDAAKTPSAPPANLPSATSSLSPLASEATVIGTTPLRASPPAAERRPIDPNLPPDHPLEPGVSRSRYPATPAERIAASEAALGSMKPPVIPDPGGKSNFIAAARRAAQAATNTAPVRTSPRAAETAVPKTATAPTMFPSLIRKHARSLIIGASVLAIVLGSINIVANWLAHEPEAVTNGQTAPAPEHGAAPATGEPTAAARAARQTEPVPAAPAPDRQSSLLAPAPGFPPPTGATMPALGAVAAETTGTVVPSGTAQVPAPREAPATVATPSLPPRTTAVPVHGAEQLPAGIGGTLRAEAAKGDPAAQYEVAQRYADGRGVSQNLKTAAEWFERAAQQGLAPAQFRLGGLYEKGIGVKKDREAAGRYYALAGEAGNPKALHNLAVLYAEGLNGKPDYQAAAQWFRKAAAFGMADSQYNLGVLYARGIGVEQNLTEAYRWFGLAARGGDKESERQRDELAPRLDQKSLKAAGQAIDEFKPELPPEAANQVKVPAGGWDPVSAPSVTPGSKHRSSTPSARREAAFAFGR